MDRQLRKSVIQSFRSGDLRVVSNVGIVSEGIDNTLGKLECSRLDVSFFTG